ncbi:hypothetical protein GQ457_10G011370 [Hibiscus cannabinus]
MKPNNVTVDQIKLGAFPFSLADQAKDIGTNSTPRGVTEKQYEDPSRDSCMKNHIRDEEMQKNLLGFLNKLQKLANLSFTNSRST